MPLLVPEPFGVRPSARAASDVVTVGFAARLEVLKGPLVLLDAWSVLHARFPDAILKVAGAGEDEIAIRERAAALHLGPSCVFSGTYAGLEEKTAFLDSLDLFVLPSFTEGTPNSLIEAMAHGLPVVTTRVGGIPDVVTPNCGLLVPPGDVGALATALARLVADAVLRGRMGHAARKRYEARYTPAVVTPQLLEMYRVVLAAQIPSRDC
jgi:glycosyltransferase involved in cell wall biosynthesis